MEFIKCVESHIPSVTEFYHKVIDYLETHTNYPFWSSEHPSDEAIALAVRRGEQYACLIDGKVAGAVSLSENPEGYYEAGEWSRSLSRGEYLSVHVLAVDSDFYNRGVGSFMIDGCVSVARKSGYKALRLDIVPKNTPAERLYRKKGFTYAGTKDLLRGYPQIPVFDLYELNLE